MKNWTECHRQSYDRNDIILFTNMLYYSLYIFLYIQRVVAHINLNSSAEINEEIWVPLLMERERGLERIDTFNQPMYVCMCATVYMFICEAMRMAGVKGPRPCLRLLGKGDWTRTQQINTTATLLCRDRSPHSVHTTIQPSPDNMVYWGQKSINFASVFINNTFMTIIDK